MEFKNVVKRIMDDNELKSQLKNVTSFGEVFNFFRANGYEGTEKELKEKLLKIPTPPRMLLRKLPRRLSNDGLADVAGGISGRQALAACAGLIMLTGTISNILNLDNHVSAKSANSSTETVTSNSSNAIDRKKLSQFSNLYINYWLALYATNLTRDYADEGDQDHSDSTDALCNKIYAFSQIELLKYKADISNLNSGTDVTEYKSKLDKLLSETDFREESDENFSRKLDEITSVYSESLAPDFTDDAEYVDILKHSLTKEEKTKLLKSLMEKIESFDKKFGTLWSDKMKILTYHLGICIFFAEGSNLDINPRNESDVNELLKITGMNEKELEGLMEYFGKI